MVGQGELAPPSPIWSYATAGSAGRNSIAGSPREPEFTVKNTFVDVEGDASRFLTPIHHNGAHTCSARLGDAASGAAAPFSPPTLQLTRGCRDPDDESDEPSDDASTTACGNQEAPATPPLGPPSAPGSMVILQLPLEVDAEFLPSLQDNIELLLRSSAVDAATGQLSLELRVVLGPGGSPASAASPAAAASPAVVPQVMDPLRPAP